MKRTARLTAFAITSVAVTSWVSLLPYSIYINFWSSVDDQVLLQVLAGVLGSVFLLPVVVYYILRGVYVILDAVMN